MQPNELEERYLEKTLSSGEVITLSHDSGHIGFDVDCWQPNGDNRWHRWYMSYSQAKVEYDRWN